MPVGDPNRPEGDGQVRRPVPPDAAGAALLGEAWVIVGLPVLTALLVGAIHLTVLGATEFGFEPGEGVVYGIGLVLPGIAVVVSLRAWLRRRRQRTDQGAWVAAALVPVLVTVGLVGGLFGSHTIVEDRREYRTREAQRICAELLCPPDPDAISDRVNVSMCRALVEGFELCTPEGLRCLRRDAGLQRPERDRSVKRCVEAWLEE